MGCTASKLDNEDTVRRCKDRRRLMKESVAARHHLSAAHFDYLHSLRRTGEALLAFAAGEPLQVHNHSPAVLLRTTAPPPKRHHMPKPPNPPPRQREFTTTPPPAPSQHHAPKPASVADTQPQKSSYTDAKTPLRAPAAARQMGRSKKAYVKLPHILSDSSFASSPPHNSKDGGFGYTYDARANSAYSATPSQTSSVWNWDNFYPPPSPPDSEYFNQLHNNKNHSKHSEDDDDDDDFDDKSSNFTSDSRDQHHLGHKGQGQRFDDRASKASSFRSYSDRGDHRKSPFGARKTASFAEYDDGASEYSSYSRYSHNPGAERGAMERKAQSLNRWESEEEIETEREEVQCSEWGDHDHYTITSSSSDEDREDSNSRSEVGSARNGAKSFKGGELGGGGGGGIDTSSNIKSSYKSEKHSSVDDGRSSVGWGKRVQIDKEEEEEEEENMERQLVVRHKDLAEIVEAIREYFNKAASSGEQVSEMLETGRAQLDRSFKQLKKTVYHSSGMLSNLSSSWTSKPPLAVKYRFEPSSIEESGGPKSLCSTLERLLAWEKKLYQEVKSREGVIIEHEKKLSVLQSQEYKGEDDAKLDKTKASIKRLQSLISVTSQAVTTTSSAIVGLRDSDLVPQLVELCHGFMYMWRSMNQYHEIQNDVVQQVRGLVNRTTKGGPTSDLHRQATKDLESAASAWHASFCRLIKFQREFVQSLHGWFKLTLIPVSSNAAEETNPRELPEVFAFFDEWKLALDRVPDTVASEAIKSFINVVHSIALKQAEEVKVKKRVESASKELEKKASSLRSIEKKYYHSYSMVGVGFSDMGSEGGGPGPVGLDARDPLFEKKAELAGCQRRVEEEMVRHSKTTEVTRAMTLNNIQTGLPGVFQAMTSFSGLITEALQTVCTKSYAI